jgi:hypothetical protein
MNASGSQLAGAIEETTAYLNTVRETKWSRRLTELRLAVEAHPSSGARDLLAALPEFDSLYLTIRNGHNVSERQEILSNGKLTEYRRHLQQLAEDQLSARE